MKAKTETKDALRRYRDKFSTIFNKYFDYHKKNLVFPLIFILIFYGVALILRLNTGKNFYLFNFVYIGTALGLGLFMSSSLRKTYAGLGRRITQFLIGAYMLIFVGFLLQENIQIEGFFFYTFSGVFTGAMLHYIIAKIIGPLIFNRGWCGWACWTAMVLDVLPWKNPQEGRNRSFEKLRYVSLLLSISLAFMTWFVLGIKNPTNLDEDARFWMITGNIIYYTFGIALAFIMKDNRAFCKYLCPIAVIMKLTAGFSLLKLGIYKKRCTECGLCEANCPMNIKLLDYKKQGKRILSTECILCSTCIDSCPEKAIHMTFKYDFGFQEYLNYQETTTPAVLGKSNNKSPIRITAVMGTTRKGENERVVEKIKKHIKEDGDIQFDIIYLKDKNIEFCRGCHNCILIGEDKCPINDDVKGIEEQLMLSDGVIFVSPAYALNVSAIMKNYMDRTAYNCHRPKYFNQRAMLVCNSSPFASKKVIEAMSSVFDASGFHITSSLETFYLPVALSSEEMKRLERRIEEKSKKFIQSIKSQMPRKPIGIGGHMHFFFMKKNAEKFPEIFQADYKYFRQRRNLKWFVDTSLDKKQYFLFKLIKPLVEKKYDKLFK